MSSVYIGVYKALFDYDGHTDEELSIRADDLLYLLERSDIDDWWKVKKRVLPSGDEEVDEPTGLVPSNYIEEAPTLRTATALYDYDKQTEDEISFKEGELFYIYDLSDNDWYLVSNSTKTAFGFIPSNYIESNDVGVTGSSQYSQPTYHEPQSISTNFDAGIAPPKHPAQVQREETPPPTPDKEWNQDRRAVDPVGDVDDVPPPMPTRPLPSQDQTTPTKYEREEDVGSPKEHKFDGDFFTWYIDEVDGRKKRAVIFSIGKGLIILKPNSTNPKKLKLKSASSLDHEWRIRDLLDYSHEKKHLFLEFKNPSASIELHTGTKDVAEAIVSILGDLKGAEAAVGLREVANASHTTTGDSNRKIARLLYDFEAQGDDELNALEGDEVYILDETKSKEWWMCQNVDTRKQGVIPSSYLEIIGTSNLEKLTDYPQRTKSSKGRVVEGSKNGREHYHRHRSRDEREKIREKDKLQRNKSSSRGDKDQSMPNYHRVRTWIDSTGSFKVEAEFLGYVDGKVHLHKTNGVKIAVAAAKLSLEDLEYIEKVANLSLESYKNEVARQNAKRARRASGAKSGPSATAVINDVQPSSSKQKQNSSIPVHEPDYDWFDFFLGCGIDIGNCQRYTLTFNREQMDEGILEDITPSLLRTLGLREGDIIKVMKFLDKKFNRVRPQENERTGGLFTEPSGELKNNNSRSEISKVDASALPSPVKQEEPPKGSSGKFEDDAWAVKPAARSNEDLSKPNSQPQTPQFTGSLQDLVSIKPMDPNVNKRVTPEQDQTPSAPSLVPMKTSNTGLDQKVNINKTGPQLPPQATGNMIPVQRTGNLIPVQRTGASIAPQQTGLMTSQPTGFIPITAQPTGFIPIQPTGGLTAQLTFGVIPLETGQTTFNAQKTGGNQAPNFTGAQSFQPNIVPLQTGNVTVPHTTFNQPLSLQATGPLVPTQRTGNAPASAQHRTGLQMGSSFVPQSTFGQQITGGFNGPPFGSQTTGGFNPNSIGQGTVQQPKQYSFDQGAPPNTFNQGYSTGFGQMPQQGGGNVPFTSFNSTGGPSMIGGMQQQLNNYNPFPQSQPNFNSFGSNPNIDQVTGMFQNSNLTNGPPMFQSAPISSFGNSQPQGFEGFNQPLQSQPTGSGFGNGPSLQPQQTGRRANLHAATPDNPFGF